MDQESEGHSPTSVILDLLIEDHGHDDYLKEDVNLFAKDELEVACETVAVYSSNTLTLIVATTDSIAALAYVNNR